MANDDGAELQRRKTLTFEQAEGTEPLPTLLDRTTIDDKLRAQLWLVIQLHVKVEYSNYGPSGIEGVWSTILLRKSVHYDHVIRDNLDVTFDDEMKRLKQTILKGTYDKVYGLFQWILRDGECPDSFRRVLAAALEQGMAPYRIVDKDTLLPKLTADEAAAVETALSTTRLRYSGAHAHYRDAIDQFSAGRWPASINASIDAVESMVKVLSGKQALPEGVKVLQPKLSLHPALSSALQRIYGYASDEDGLRHSLGKDAASTADEPEARLMLTTCAAFVQYLADKSLALGE